MIFGKLICRFLGHKWGKAYDEPLGTKRLKQCHRCKIVREVKARKAKEPEKETTE